MSELGLLNLPDALEFEPLGSRIKIRALGRSMRPLFFSGDVLTIERCTEQKIHLADVAVVRNETGRLLAHLVVSVHPIQTAPLYGPEDLGKLVVLGRVTAIDRVGLALPLPRISRPALITARRIFIWASSRGILHRGASALAKLIGARATLPFRQRLLEPVTVRKLERGDLEPLLVFAGRYVGVTSETLRHQLLIEWPRARTGGVGAFDRSGRLLGFSSSETTFVVPAARGLDLERRMGELLQPRL